MKKCFLKSLPVVCLLASVVPSSSAEEEKKVEPNPPVETVVVHKREYHPATEMFGLALSPANATLMVTIPAEAKIKALAVHSGQAVKAGDLLMELEPSLDFDVAQSAAKLTGQALDSAAKRFDLKLIPLSDLLTAKQTAEEARLKLAHLLAAGLSTDGRQLLATAGGVIEKISAAPGTTVAAGESLVEMTTSDGVEVRGGVSPEATVEVGQKAKVTTLGRKVPLVIDGEVQSVSRALNGETHLLDVTIRLPDPAGIHPGETVQVALPGPSREAVLVPKAALLSTEGETIVFTLKDGHAVRHVVELGGTEDDEVEIVGDGIADGDTVVTTGNSQVSDGMAVELPGAEKKQEKDEK